VEERFTGLREHAQALVIERKLRRYTMVPTPRLIDNLMLVSRVRDLPEAVVECGVWKGGMSVMEDEQDIYRVVVNHEEQYSIWPEYREIPSGWRDGGVIGTRQVCLDHIEKAWTDMRPLSLRKRMDELKDNPPPAPPPAQDEPEEPTLVERLSNGRHPVEISLRPARELARFKECLDRGYVHVKFTGTRGGTELGVRLTKEETDLSQADFESGSGEARLAGTLTLDFVKVHCYATIRLPELAGEGYLAPAAV
jgi:uncharacterized protein YbdZ (MbtH family)